MSGLRTWQLGLAALVAWTAALALALTLEGYRPLQPAPDAVEVIGRWQGDFPTLPDAAQGGGALDFVLHLAPPARRASGHCLARVAIWTQPGYSDRILLLADLTADARIAAVQVLESRETPGIGAPPLRASGWLGGFRDGRFPHAVSGATFTTGAVRDTLRRLAAAFADQGGAGWMRDACPTAQARSPKAAAQTPVPKTAARESGLHGGRDPRAQTQRPQATMQEGGR